VPADTEEFLKRVYQNLPEDQPLEPGDPRYEPVYELPGCEDPVRQLERRIRFAGPESVSYFSGFRGSGKTTELFRLRKKLRESGYVVLYADALKYINPAQPIEIQDLLIVLAGAFGDALEEEGIDIRGESYWNRLYHWLKTTEVIANNVEFKAGGLGLKAELRASPTFRQLITEALRGRLSDVHDDVRNFCEEGFKSIRRERGAGAPVVFIFDSLEQIRGSLFDERDVIRSVERLFANHAKFLSIPYLHVVYTVPPWLKFVLPGVKMDVLPCVRLWENNAERTTCAPGMDGFRSLVEKRFTPEGLVRFFGPDPWKRAGRLLDLCGGHFRDLLLLLRETVLRAEALPVSDEAMEGAIRSVKSTFLPIASEDAKWLAGIEEKRDSLLQTTDSEEINRLTRFLDTHVVLYLKNGEEWYDVHPLIRNEVAAIAKSAEAS
jgi:hypothetical protein